METINKEATVLAFRLGWKAACIELAHALTVGGAPQEIVDFVEKVRDIEPAVFIAQGKKGETIDQAIARGAFDPEAKA